MASTMYTDLGEIGRLGPLRFLRAEWWRQDSRFVLLRYSLDNHEVQLGLRMDLDKKVILDHLDDAKLDAAVQERAPEIWGVVARKITQQRQE